MVGPAADVRSVLPTGSEVEDLDGRLVVPGLIDAHHHPRAAVLARSGLDLADCRSAPLALERLAERLHAGGRGPLLAYGWNDVPLTPSDRIDREALDRLETDRPIVLYHPSLHTAVANSAALSAAGLDDRSSDPPGGQLGRKEGALDGRLSEGALGMLGDLEQRAFAHDAAGVLRWLRDAAALGLTALGAMAIEPRDLEHIATSGGPRPLPIRLRAYLPLRAPPSVEWPPPNSGDGRVRTVGIKLYLDGALGPRTAWLSRPYEDDPRTSGAPGMATGELAEVLSEAGMRGYQVALHAIGDEALRIGLRSVRREGASTVVRFEHASLTPPSLVTLLASLNVPVAVQPMFRRSDSWLTERLGVERADWAYALRALADLGVPMAGSSDAPVETMDPWAGMVAAMNPRSGAPPGQELTAVEALGLYSTGGGRVLREPELGSLEPGAVGDVVVLAARDLGLALTQGAAGVRATYVGGEATFQRPME